MIKYKGKGRLTPSELGLTYAPCRMRYTVHLTEESKYTNTAIPPAIQKFFGLGFGHPHKNSVRVGWNWSEEKEVFQIFSYIYKNGTRYERLLGTCPVNSTIRCVIDVQEDRLYIDAFGTNMVTANEESTIYDFTFKGLAYHMNTYTEDIDKVSFLATEPRSRSYNTHVQKLDKYKFPIFVLFAILMTFTTEPTRWVLLFTIFIPTIVFAFYEVIKTFFYDKHDIPKSPDDKLDSTDGDES